jgi:membrane protease subunit HflC
MIENARMYKFVAAGVILLAGLIVLLSSVYMLDETEQAVIVQFGAPVGDVVETPGLHIKTPFIQEVRRFDKRLIVWDGDPNQIPTLGREFISVDTTARWRIIDPLLFLKSVKNEMGAQSRLDDIIDSVVRDNISETELIDIVRSKDWEVKEEDMERMILPEDEKTQEVITQEVKIGREDLIKSFREEAEEEMLSYGIELVDVRIKRLNYIPSVQKQVFERMISERQRIAERFRAEGSGESSRIVGQTQKELAEIISNAKRQQEIIKGDADAEATRIYNESYSADPEFYAFYRSLESYANSLKSNATLILGTESDYFRYISEADTPSGDK